MEAVITALVTIIGLFLTVGTPIIKLNGNIVKLNTNLAALQKQTDKQDADIEKMKNHASESHQRLWDHNDEQDKLISENKAAIAAHAKRIEHLERR